MKIGFDAKRAFLNQSGLGNYARSLVSSLSENFRSDEYALFTTRVPDISFTNAMRSKTNVSIENPTSFIDRKLRARWRSYGITDLLISRKIQLYHGLSNELPFNIQKFSGRKVVTVHDLIFLRHPGLYPFLDRSIYNRKCRHSCHVADVIVAVSEQTKRDLEELYFLPESRIRVIYQGSDPSFYEDPGAGKKAEVRTRYKLPAEYILHVGTIEDRKNLITVVKALEDVKDIALVVIGKKKGHFSAVDDLLTKKKMRNRVFFFEDVPLEDLPAIYRQAKAFAYPSLIEGFGIPIIEALASRVPVITSKGGCFPEAGGPGTIYIDPEDPEELADKLKEILSSESLSETMRSTGETYVKKFHPSVIAAQMHELYRSLY